MKQQPTKRAKIGALVEIRTPKGLAYAQYTHKLPMHGSLLRIFPGLYSERPLDLSGVLSQAPQFSTFFPLQHAINQGVMKIVGDYPVASQIQQLPTFRVPMPDLRTGEIRSWWFWDGDKEWPVGELSSEQRKMPIREVVNDTLLIERIVMGWKPEVEQHGHR